MLLFGIAQLVRRAAASWFVNRASRAASLPGGLSAEIVANLRRAMQFDPDDPRHSALLGRTLQYSMEGGDVAEVLRFAERAAALGPHRAQLWAELGAAYEWAGRAEAAQRAYAQALALFPNSPEINWQLGNYALRSGRTHEAAGFLRICILHDAALRRPAFDLAWRASGDAVFILEEVVPPDSRSLLAYLDYLADTERFAAAATIWARLREAGFDFDPSAAFHYFDMLLEHNRGAEIALAWNELAAAHPAIIAARGPGGNLLVNGDFESEPVDGGLDWRVPPMPGVELRIVTSAFYSGTHSLEIRFVGTENVAYGNVRQSVPVQPNTRYRFTGHLRAEGITTDSGPRFQIYDPQNSAALAVALPAVLGSSSWSAHTTEFVTGPQTTLLLVRVLREPSGKFLREFRGSVWVDALSLMVIK